MTSAGLYLASIMDPQVTTATLCFVRRNPAMLAKAAAKYNITVKLAAYYLDGEIRARAS